MMQVAVSPSHHYLKDIVQASEIDTAGYLNTPPNSRFAISDAQDLLARRDVVTDR